MNPKHLVCLEYCDDMSPHTMLSSHVCNALNFGMKLAVMQ